MPVERVMFGVMVPVREKQAMDFVSDQTGMPLARIFYDTIHRTAEVSLGRALIDMADMGKPTASMPILPVKGYSGVPQIFRDFAKLMGAHTDGFAAIFPKFDFSFDLSFVDGIGMEGVCSALGREYLAGNAAFGTIPREDVRSRLFRALLFEFYRASAIGPILDLEESWQARKQEVDGLSAILAKEYLELYPEVVEVVLEPKPEAPEEKAIEPEVVEEAEPKEEKKGRKK